MAKPTPEEIEQLHAQSALDRAWAIREEYRDLLERRKANRVELRGKLTQNVLTDEQAAEVRELYPDRGKTEEEVADEAEAADLQEAAA